MTGTMGAPSGPDTDTPSVVVYLRPSLKMCPASIALMISSGEPQRGHGSPARTSRRSAQRPTLMSRATSTPVRCMSSMFAPVVAAEQRQRDLAVDHVDERLDLPVRRLAVLPGQVVDGPHARGRQLLGRG